MAIRLLAVTFDAHDPARVGGFWAALLHREVVNFSGGVLLTGEPFQLGLRFVADQAPKVAPNLAHIHLTSETAGDQHNTVARALEIGALHLDFGQTAEEGHVVLADPEGNELCVIEPHNNYLAGCGLFGELACDGSRDAGLFWSSVLHWPLVWDQGDETAIQSPDGGTKISWGGEPAAPPEVRRRHRFYLVTAEDQEIEVDRLVSLGATCLRRRADRTVVLADVDGNPFEVGTP